MEKLRKRELRPGNFWELDSRMRQGSTPDLALTTCTELACRVEQRLAPCQPSLVWQNGGGCVQASELSFHQVKELLIVHHYPCHFLAGLTPEESLRREWERLQASVSLEAENQPLIAHLWLLEGEKIKVYEPLQNRLVDPLDLVVPRQAPLQK